MAAFSPSQIDRQSLDAPRWRRKAKLYLSRHRALLPAAGALEIR